MTVARSLWSIIRRKFLFGRFHFLVKALAFVACLYILIVHFKLLFKGDMSPNKAAAVNWSLKRILNSVFNAATDGKGQINIEIWHGLCLLNFNALRQYPLFPWEPNERSYMKVRDSLTIDKDGSALAVRTMGYLHPPATGFYSFHLRSHTMAQLWLSTSGPRNTTKIAYTTHNVADNHSFYVGNPRPASMTIYLYSGKKYYFELWHAVNDPLIPTELEKTNVQWMGPGSNDFVKINGQYVSLFYSLSSHKHKTHRPSNDVIGESPSLQFSDEEDKFTGPLFPLNKSMTTNKKTKIHLNTLTTLLELDPKPLSHVERSTLPYIERSKLTKAFPKCIYNPSYMKRTTYKRYDGVWNVRFPSLYPYDGSWNIRWGSPYSSGYSDDRFEGAVFFKDDEAASVVQSFMKTFNKKYPGKFKLARVINLEKVNDKEKGDRFFLEMVLRHRHDNKLYRVSEFFYRNTNQTRLCFLNNMRWSQKVWINVILNVKNQAGWLLYFIKEMARIVRESHEEHVNFIVADYGNDGLDIGQEMMRQGLKNHIIIKKSGRFHKTSTINMAASKVKDPNSIVLLMDLHLRYPSNLFEKIRKHTIRGKMAFSPILLRLVSCGRPKTKHLFASGFWESLGFGIFGIYKSDWDNFGGMNEEEFKNKWGGEDWEMVDRVLMKGIEIEKLRLPGFYHFYHDKKGMWNT